MFRAMGHPSISILNGGLPEWQRAGFATAGDHAVAAIKGDFVAAPQSGYFVDIATVQGVLQQGQALIDARSAERFFGKVDEPRPGIRRGNIPGSHNLCFQNVLNHSGYLPIPELTQCFKGLQLDQNAPLIFSCGSGITACINAVAARLCGFEKVSVYDGSWCEWATVYPETSG